ncbi:glycerol-3-phosphate dehydrogenase/oxidase [Paenalcaligenes niemegkensis]|uniref:glycerol-3-phosphate dehydrogenase/oxidase n=1 Tax=Paenalcaligenes niemegkensis TaxID=2895469 RepID=UPI001EE959A6|nr:glycerol-3-phosphate dehydrogenase/oxidase [Paenalcaligenes niemegkensis]MCQ9615967.1 glycerol-3-phosphate dehydrogenase/oxidase [Paenalcaligenes niemegkensis]
MNSRTSPLPTDRAQILAALARTEHADVVVIGGGATGLGIALDAALRGLNVVLLEAGDFAVGTSSRATKLVHGGVRYLAQGNVSLVREALYERATFMRIAPHLAQPLGFVMPSYKCWETPFYGVGLKAYDALAGTEGLGNTRFLNTYKTLQELPGVKRQGLKGGVMYWDGQFDDARMALALARSAAAASALMVNHCKVVELLHANDSVCGVRCVDNVTQREFTIHAPCVINATGVWVDGIRQLDEKVSERHNKPLVSPSQGVHLVVDCSFMPSQHALLVPKTKDGRVLFAVPWLGKLILGTTDTPSQGLEAEPRAFPEEVDFILGEAANYLEKAPTRADVRSVWVGLRPLVRNTTDSSNTKRISREHTIVASPSGLVTVTGGKWTTYRSMADDVLQQCQDTGVLPKLPPSVTAFHKLVGTPNAGSKRNLGEAATLLAYGEDANWVSATPGHDIEIIPGVTEAMVRFAARYEYALTVEDVLARRVRTLFLDARLAASAAARVAELLFEETGVDPAVERFLELAEQYATVPA